jgi:hypothetical protein
MELRIATEEDKKKWDNIIANSYGGTVFHTLKYLECLESHTTTTFMNRTIKGKLFPLVAREGVVIVALFPLFLYTYHGIRFVRSGNDREDLMYLGPVFLEGDTLKPAKLQIRALRLQKEINQYLTCQLKAHSINLRVSPFFPDARPYLWSGYDVYPLHTNFYYLDRGIDPIWSGFNKGVRKIIINAQENNLVVEPGEIKDAEEIFHLLNIRKRTNSSKILILDIIRKLYPENCSIFVIKKDGRVQTGIIVLHHGHYAHLWIGFPKSDTDLSGANELLMWEVIKWASHRGYQVLENIGADDIVTFQFKRKFNPAIKQYFKAESPSLIFRSYKYIRRLMFSSRKDIQLYCGD